MTKMTPSNNRLNGFRWTWAICLTGDFFRRELAVLVSSFFLGGGFRVTLEGSLDSISSSESSLYTNGPTSVLTFFGTAVFRGTLKGGFDSFSSSDCPSSYNNRPVAARRPPALTGDTSPSFWRRFLGSILKQKIWFIGLEEWFWSYGYFTYQTG